MAPSRRKGANKAAAAAAARRQWKIGDLVLAKVKGFPAWPATVSEPEKWGYSADWKKVLVYFFGTQQIAFCNPADVEAFTEEKKESLLGKRHGKGADFVRAVHEIIECYEKLKKQDHTNNAKTTVGHTMVTENNSGESLIQSFANGEAPITSCERKTPCDAEEDDVNVKSEVAAAVSGGDGVQDRDMPAKEDSSSLVLTEMALVNVDSSRENSERTQAPKCFTRRRPPSARRARSSSRAAPNKLQTRTTRSGTIAPSILRDGPGRRNKRIRKSPDIYGHDVDSPDLVSNGSIEGNDSEILTGDSDSLSLNEGSTVESECKTIFPDSTTELCQRNVELSQRLDFQMNGIYKKKRMPNRKRPSSDAVEFTARPDEKPASDADAIKREHIPPGDQEISTERLPKEDGDEHLPLVKRARVRMGRILSTGEQPETSLDTEEKPPEICSSISDRFHVLSDREGDGSTDWNPFPAKGDVESSSPPAKHQSIKHQVWEVRKYQHFGSSVEGEAALPPSKRLHRALEAMSANAAEDHQTASDGPSMIKADTSGCCSPSSDDCLKLYLERKLGNEFGLGIAEENLSNNNPQDGASECSVKSDLPIEEERVSSVELATCCGDEKVQRKSCKEDVVSTDDKNVLKSSSNDPIDSVGVVQSPESLPPRGAHLNGQCSPDVALPPEDDCKTGSSELTKSSENLGHKTNLLLGDNIIIHSPNLGTDMETDSAVVKRDDTVDLCQLLPDNNELANEVSKDAGEIGSAIEDSSASLCPVSAVVMGDNNEDNGQSCSNSTAHVHLSDKSISGTKSSPSPTYNLDTTTHAKPHTSTCNISISVNSSFQVEASRSPATHTHHDIQRTAGKWNYKEAHDALTTFEGFLGTLTRTKESIGRATRIAIDCAKLGVAAKVVEILAHSLEREASLHRRVDLFFLVDSIAQCSRGLKGDVGGVYPSAILALLPRLLSAAAPPGSNSQENRRQCLKVLRVWQERRILPESIVRHHIRELDSLCGSSCSRSFSRRLRNERSFDDPIREMEGMLVDEYGSNSSIQLPGFRMPPMLRDEDDGIDSDGESFEAVTPEHETDKTEGERNPVLAVGKHRHILEDVDGELEMEDVAPSSEAVISSSNSAAIDIVQTAPHSIGNAVTVPFAPPLPRDVPPMSPPLPKSPPPPPPPPPPPLAPASFALPSERPDNLSNSVGSKVYISSQNIEDDLREATGQQSIAPGVNPAISDAVQSSRSSHIEFHSQVPKQIANSTHCSLNSLPISNPPVQAVNNIPPSDGAFNKGFRLRPPHPAPSNQFSYVQADRRVQSRRDIPPPSHPTRFHGQNTENGNFYRDCDRPKLAPHDTGEHWRTTFPGPRYPDGSRMPYTPAPYPGQPGEPALHGNRWAFPPGAMNHRVVMPQRPPAGGPIPVAARGPNCWRPR